MRTPPSAIPDAGEDASWDVRAGTLWRSDFTHTADDGTPTDITSVTIAAAVFDSEDATAPLASFTVTKTAPTAGQWSIALTGVDNAAIVARTAPYWWAMQWNPLGSMEPLVSGDLVVKPWPGDFTA